MSIIKLNTLRLKDLIEEAKHEDIFEIPENQVLRLETIAGTKSYYSDKYLLTLEKGLIYTIAKFDFDLSIHNLKITTSIIRNDNTLKFYHPKVPLNHELLPSVHTLLGKKELFIEYSVANDDFYSGQILMMFDAEGLCFDLTALVSKHKKRKPFMPKKKSGERYRNIPDFVSLAAITRFYHEQDPSLEKVGQAMDDEEIKPVEYLEDDTPVFKREDLNKVYGLSEDHDKAKIE